MAIILDARTPEEFKSCHIPGAVSFPISQFKEKYHAFADLLAECKTIITYCEGIHCTDSSEENRDLALGFLGRAGHGELVEFHVGDALQVLGALPGPFDIIFNDIDKEQYPDVVQPAVSRLRPGGLLITDNTLWKGRVAQADPDETTRAVLEYNRHLHAHPDLEACIVPIRDGVAVAARR